MFFFVAPYVLLIAPYVFLFAPYVLFKWGTHYKKESKKERNFLERSGYAADRKKRVFIFSPAFSFPGPADLLPCFFPSGRTPPSSRTKAAATLRQRAPGRRLQGRAWPSWRPPGSSRPRRRRGAVPGSEAGLGYLMPLLSKNVPI